MELNVLLSQPAPLADTASLTIGSATLRVRAINTREYDAAIIRECRARATNLASKEPGVADEAARDAELAATAAACVVGWYGVFEDGHPVEYTPALGEQMLRARYDVYREVRLLAQSLYAKRFDAVDAASGN